MNDDWGRLQDLFEEVCALDEDSRRLVLDQRCNGHVGLRSEVERMVRAFDDESCSQCGSSRRLGRQTLWSVANHPVAGPRRHGRGLAGSPRGRPA